jgi:3-oxoacyl-(acyl-carrier-protein) synthase
VNRSSLGEYSGWLSSAPRLRSGCGGRLEDKQLPHRAESHPITKFDAGGFLVRFACEVKDFDPLDYVEKKEARKMGAFTHYAIAASDEALAA